MICPTCYEKHPSDVATCPADGTALVPDETFAHVDRDVAPGAVVGEYRVEKKIGQGGFGAVYRAVHPVIGKPAAIKILSRQFSASPQTVSRFVAEARAVNQIRHRNIIDIFSFGQLPDGRQYYIMELLEGTTFDGYIADRGRLPIEETLEILRPVARALDAAHAKGLLHRDLKPENVFVVVDEDGRVQPKLLDFGLVKLLDEPRAGDEPSHKTKTGTPMGTPYYMSPEQCRGHEVGPRTDVYSFGAMAFEALTGRVPYQGSSAMDILLKHMSAPVPRASEIVAGIPAEVDAAITRMLAKEPSERPASVGEALELLARGAGVDVAPVKAVRVIAPSGRPSDPKGASALAQTLAADSATSRPTGGETFLDSSQDVLPRASRSRSIVVGGLVAGLVAAAAVVYVVAVPRTRMTAAMTATAATSAPPAVATPSAVPVAATEAPRAVALRVDAPSGTTVSADGIELGKAPGPFKLKAGVKVVLAFAAAGYKPKELTITPAEDGNVTASMERLPAAVGRPRPKPAGSTLHSDLEGFDPK